MPANDKPRPATIDEFIATFPEDVRQVLQQLRETIRRAAPAARETINYGIPTFTLNGNLVHFSAYPRHIGFYPGASGIERFKEELTAYPSSKGAIRFPLLEPLPLDLIARIVAFRVAENMTKPKIGFRKKN